MIADTIGLWLNIIMTIACISFVFKPNPLFRFAEATVMGVAIGNVCVLAIGNIKSQCLNPISQGAYIYVVPFILGLMLYARFHPQLSWLSRYPTMLLIGIGTGLAVRGAVPAQIIAQINVAMRPFVANDVGQSFNNTLALILFTSTLVFFFFTWEPKGEKGKKAMNYIQRLGRVTIMIYLGSAFSSAAMARIIVMAERLVLIMGV